jgi:hypothetical protein
MSNKNAHSEEESWLAKHIVTVLVSLFIVAFVSGAVVVAFYAKYFPGEIIADHDKWGTLGDFFGGTLNPIFGFIGLFALLLTIAIQSKELSNSTKELRTSAKALNEQSESIKLQNFESTFFQMLRLHNEIVDGLRAENTNKNTPEVHTELTGRNCFKEFYYRFEQHYQRANKDYHSDGAMPVIESAYEGFFQEKQADIGHYFRNLYTIIKFVDQSTAVDNKKHYTSIVRAQLSSYELALLFYNCLWHVGKKKFYDLILKYELLENMSIKLLKDEKSHIPLYAHEAYGELELPTYGE